MTAKFKVSLLLQSLALGALPIVRCISSGFRLMIGYMRETCSAGLCSFEVTRIAPRCFSAEYLAGLHLQTSNFSRQTLQSSLACSANSGCHSPMPRVYGLLVHAHRHPISGAQQQVTSIPAGAQDNPGLPTCQGQPRRAQVALLSGPAPSLPRFQRRPCRLAGPRLVHRHPADQSSNNALCHARDRVSSANSEQSWLLCH